MKRVVVVGGGFAGLWSAAGAARKLAEIGAAGEVSVTLVDRHAYHGIRVRNYEADLAPLTVPFDDVLDPIGIGRVEGEVLAVDTVTRQVSVADAAGDELCLPYDRLVYALGSMLHRPTLPGLAEHAHDVDTYEAACRLQRHLATLPERPPAPGRETVLVVGGGLTGLETATEMATRLRTRFGADAAPTPRVLLLDAHAQVGAAMGGALPAIESALAALGVESRGGVGIAALDARGLTLAGGEFIPAATIVWCAGMRANPLARCFPVETDRLGRLPVDDCLRVRGLEGVFAAGDAAWSSIDGVHASVMSCQHARPMGRHAGHNVISDLYGLPLLPLQIDWYVTVLDLGAWGAAYTVGWDRQLVATGAQAKRTKQIINGERIYPPRQRDRAAILAAAAPVVQAPPEVTSRRPGA